MISDPASPNAPVDPDQNPDVPAPNTPTPGPDLPSVYPPSSPGAPSPDAPVAPVTMRGGTAYPQPPPAYEAFPTTPPGRSGNIPVGDSSRPEPAYQPSSLHGVPHADTRPGQQPQSAEAAYPTPPPVYERRATDRDPNAPVPSPAPPNFGRRHSDHQPDPSPPSGSPRVPSRAPTVVLILVVVLALGVIAAGAAYFFRSGGHVITAGGELAATAAGLHYENGHEHIAFTAPGTWTRFPASTAQVMVRGEGCSFGLLEQRTLLSAQQLADAEARDLRRRHPEAAPTVTARTIAGRDALTFSGTYTSSEGQPMIQTYILVDRGSNLLTLIETGTSDSCPSSFSSLEDSLHI